VVVAVEAQAEDFRNLKTNLYMPLRYFEWVNLKETSPPPQRCLCGGVSPTRRGRV